MGSGEDEAEYPVQSQGGCSLSHPFPSFNFPSGEETLKNIGGIAFPAQMGERWTLAALRVTCPNLLSREICCERDG